MEVSDGELIYTDFDPLYGEMEVRQQVPSGERSHVPPHHYVLVTDKVNYTDEDILRNCSEWVNGTWSNNISYDCSVWMNETWSNNTFYDLDMYSTGFKIAIAIIYNCVFLLALIGNSLVCYVVFSSPRMRTTTNYLIANLALGDLLMAVLCVPFSYIPVLLQYWPFGHFLCYLLPPAQAISVLVSSYTLIVLAVDRYIAIIFPLRPRFRRSQACWVILLVWFIAIITASPIAIFTEYYTLNETGLFYCEEVSPLKRITSQLQVAIKNFISPFPLGRWHTNICFNCIKWAITRITAQVLYALLWCLYFRREHFFLSLVFL